MSKIRFKFLILLFLLTTVWSYFIDGKPIISSLEYACYTSLALGIYFILVNKNNENNENKI